jgi:thiol:disulfide interchange protein DsbC
MLKYLLLLTLACSSVAHAATAPSEEKIKEALESKYPQLGEVDKVYKSNILGLYEVILDGKLFYTDEKTQYLIAGNIIELKSSRNLTEERNQKLFKVDFDTLPLELAVKRVKGDGSRKMAYLTDPNCGFCKKLEHELQSVDNVTLYRFLYPIFPGSDEKVKNVLCSSDPNKIWENWMVNGVTPPSASCATPQTAKVTALGKQLFVSGTPTLIFADGTKVPGYLPAPDLEKALNGEHTR